MTSDKIDAPTTSKDDTAVYLIFNSMSVTDVEKIPVKDIALVDIREKDRDDRILFGMLLATVICGILVALEIVFDMFWISDGILEVLCGLCVLFLTSSFWYFSIKRYEVMITFNSGIKRLLE
ncbi:MAG: hypothetical protein WCF85_07285 [Rhodospirillaceae bacterium]